MFISIPSGIITAYSMISIETRRVTGMSESDKMIQVGIDDDSHETSIGAINLSSELFFPPSTAMDGILNILHEVGHDLGTQHSYKQNNTAILKPADVTQRDACIELIRDEKLHIQSFILSNKHLKRPLHRHTISIASKILLFLTNNQWSPESLHIHKVSKEDIFTLAKENKINTLFKRGNKLFIRDTREGRNSELNAVYIEIAGLHVFHNTIISHNLVGPFVTITQAKSNSTPHQRARNIVARAMKNKTPVPSTFDLDMESSL